MAARVTNRADGEACEIHPQNYIAHGRKGKTAADNRTRGGKGKSTADTNYPRECVYMHTVNSALYPDEGAHRCSAIVNFARGEIPRSFQTKTTGDPAERPWNFPSARQEGKGSD